MIKPIKPAICPKATNLAFKSKEIEEPKNKMLQETEYATSPFNEGYLVNFTGLFNKENSASKSKMKCLNFNMTSSAQELINESRECAKEFKSPEIKEIHVIYTGLKKISKFIDGLNDGSIRYNAETSSFITDVLESFLTPDVFKKKELRNKIKPVIDNEIENIEKELIKTSKDEKSIKRKPEFSKDLLNGIYMAYQAENTVDEDGEPISGGGFLDSHVLAGAFYPDNDKFRHEVSIPLRHRFKEAIMLDEREEKEKAHINFYDKKAENIWKNLAIGTNMFILHDEDVNPEYMLNSLQSVLNDSENGFGKLNKDNTNIVHFNKYASQDYIAHKITEAEKDKDKNYVFAFDLKKIKQNSTMDSSIFNDLTLEMEEYFKNPPKNVKFVIVDEKDDYYTKYKPTDKHNPFKEFGEITVPILNAEQTKKILKQENSPLLEKIKKTFTAPAIDKCVDATNQLSGNFPEKTIGVMEKMASYYVDKKEITANDVQNYVKEATHVFKTTENDSAINLIFNTGKKLKDLVGSGGTKNEAASIVRMIKDKSIGTKGYIIYAQDGSQGAGRKHTAQVIAGEAKVPYVEINALDFGTEKVDLFGALFGGGSSMTPEASMKKLFEFVKSQAETNPSKSALLFIENFEYFSVGEQVSEFHQKAMSQLLREMDNAKKQGLNIVVMGSMNDPQYIGASTLKSGKFVDEIAIESPMNNEDARFDILNYYIKEKKIKIEGKTPEEKAEVIKKAAEISKGFPYVYILQYIDKAHNVAKERGKKEVGTSEFIESLLQLECGRPSSIKNSIEEKELVTSHECGHALTLQFLYDLMKEQGNTRHLPDKVSFITLDPRGEFGGAMFPGKSENDEWSFGKIFSNLVCYFGGHSCEKQLYGVDGSWGITGDMEQATEMAKLAIQYMGLGPNTGKIHIENNLMGDVDLSPRMRENYDKDLECFLKNANFASDMIVDTYEPFIREFTTKYKHLVGTGKCIISSETFKKELDDWYEKQDQTKKDEIQGLKEEILTLFERTKNGKLY